MIRAPVLIAGISLLACVLRAHESAADLPCVAPDAQPVMLAMAHGKVSYCFEINDATASCFAVDVATAKVAAAPSPKPLGQTWPVLAPPPVRIKITHADSGSKPRLCHADGTHCVTLAMSHAIDQGQGLVEAVNDSLQLAALASLHFIDTFDLRTGKRLASFESGPKQSSCNSLDFANDTLVISEEADCAQPIYSAWLAKANGVKIADVGGDAPLAIGTFSMEKVGGDRFAFASAGGDTLIYQDVKTGKVDQRIALGPATSDGKAYLLGDGKSLAVIYGGTRAGDVALIDTATNKVTTLPGKRCTK